MHDLSVTDVFVCQLREIELKVQREINEKRQELLAKEESLRLVLVEKLAFWFAKKTAGTWRVDSRHRVLRATSVTRLWHVV